MNYNRYVRVRDRRSTKMRRQQILNDRRENTRGTAKPNPKAPSWSVHHVKTIAEVMEDFGYERRYHRR